MENSSHAGQNRPATVVVLLAAGGGTRFADERHKLLAPLSSAPGGESDTVIARSLANAVAADVGPIVVVTGAVDPSSEPVLRDLLAAFPDVVIRHNPDWADGQSTSLGVGIRAAQELGAAAAAVGLGDQPFISPDAWRAVAQGLGPITVATYDGTRGNPVRFRADVWALLPTSGDEGGRVLMRARPDLVTEVPCTGSPADIDTLEDLHRWQSN